MGLFSFLNKNKQEATVPDSGYYSSDDDDAVAARARSKRASSADEPAARSKNGKNGKAAVDPVLPEKKRARRRLVGAVALALAVAVGLPMVLDSEPKPLAGDIDIRIPSKDKAPAQPLPRAVAAADALDKREQIVDAPEEAPVVRAPAAVHTPAPAPAPTPARERARDLAEVKSTPKPEPVKPVKPEPKPERVAERATDKVAEKPADKLADKPAVKPVKADDKPVIARAAEKPADKAPDTERALSILEGKTADKPSEDGGQKHVVQVAALGTQEKVSELQDKLRDAGIRSYTQKVPTQSGERIRVLVGPFSKEEAEKVRAKLGKLGLSGSMVRG